MIKMNKNSKIQSSIKEADDLTNWFWDYGVHRIGEYELDKYLWLNRLYESTEVLKLESQQFGNRKSSAIWGPSQTGKSTLVARYVDGTGKATQNALFWPGGKEAYFSLPRGKGPNEMSNDFTVLNPYNGGMDASACITRFTKGSMVEDGVAGLWVSNPSFPVVLKFSSLKEIMMSLARGYDGQCKRKYEDRYWNPEKLEELCNRLGGVGDDEQDTLSHRELFEEAIALCEVLEDLAFARLPRYQGLIDKSGESSIRRIVLSQKGLIKSASRLKKFRDQILWDGEAVISKFHQELFRFSREIEKMSENKQINCSLEVASCLLDMDCYTMLKKETGGLIKEGSKEEKVRRLISNLRVVKKNKQIFLGTDGGIDGESLLNNPEEFGMLQGLVREIIIPLNFDYLIDSPFKSYLENNDLLDFPGVERGGQASNATKIILEDSEQLENLRWNDLFSKVLKRGKTASLFQGYAKHTSLDAVSIFQDLDNDKPNANDLIAGVETWWRTVEPERTPGALSPAPLPLNCVMTWWAKMLNESPTNSSSILGKNKLKYEQLGLIADPNLSSVFAINDRSLPRGKLTNDTQQILEELLSTIKEESEYANLFQTPQSKSSFDAMARSEDGGMDFFFDNLKSQVESTRLNHQGVSENCENAIKAINDLLQLDSLIPREKSKEKERIESLKIFDRMLEVNIQSDDSEVIRSTEQSIKRMFNFSENDLDHLPVKEDNLNLSFLRTQLLRKGRGREDDSCSSNQRLGFDSDYDQRKTWDALCMSIEPDLKEITSWLRRMVKQRKQFRMIDYRKFLAVRMSNQFIPHNNGMEKFSTKHRGGNASQSSPIIDGLRVRLNEFINKEISPYGRPVQSGDDEILKIKESFTKNLLTR
jgi:hypothetical protein